jgi:hypothetical protein
LEAAAVLGAEAGVNPGGRFLNELIGELTVKSSALWGMRSERRVHVCSFGSRGPVHPIVGRLALDYEPFEVPCAREQMLVAHVAPEGCVRGEPGPAGLLDRVPTPRDRAAAVDGPGRVRRARSDGIREEPVVKLRKRGAGSNLVDTDREAVHNCPMWIVDSVAGLACRWEATRKGLRRTRGYLELSHVCLTCAPRACVALRSAWWTWLSRARPAR